MELLQEDRRAIMVKKLPMPRVQKPVTPEIPDKPSEAILAALQDLEAAEKTPGYVIDMYSWFSVDCEYGYECAVCLAGAVIARAGQSKMNIRPEDFDKKTQGKLLALDSFRCGDVWEGLYNFYEKRPKSAKDLPVHFGVISYEVNPKGFKQDMKKLAEMLASSGH
jgi:hypothetical protein